jgi:hypothetical protein
MRGVGESSKMAMGGVCKRHTAEDLLHTLERDYARLPQDPDDASNVFVTAERLSAWGMVYPRISSTDVNDFICKIDLNPITAL